MRQFEGRGADILAECLIDAGIDLIFGVPGDTGVVFYDALYQRTDQLPPYPRAGRASCRFHGRWLRALDEPGRLLRGQLRRRG